MSRDFFRNRGSLGSIPQMPAVTPVFNFTKNLEFDSATDLTSNFNQVIQAGTQTVTGSNVEFRNSTYDKENSIASKFTINKIISLLMRINWWASGSASSYWCPGFSVKVLDANNTLVTDFYLSITFNYTYNESAWNYWNNQQIYWRLGTDPNTQAAAIAKRLGPVPSSNAYHTYELVDMGGGYIQFKLDGVNFGSQMYLGNATYKLGGPFYMHALGGWWNNSIYCNLDKFYLTYL